MKTDDESRREFLRYGIAGAGSVLFLNACIPPPAPSHANANTKEEPIDDPDEPPIQKKGPGDIEVTAVEDLMREHGILRRALLVYSEAAIRLRKSAADVPPDALQRTAKLFRTFGEDYHEKKLEEEYIFPKIKEKGTGSSAQYADTLIAQHTRGREITDYIISVTNGPKLTANAAAFASTFDAFVRMYEHHAAIEDTIVFPAWKDLITPDEYDKLNDKFEDIEHEQFGQDGFEDAVKQIGEIEAELGMNDLSKFTAPSPATTY
jgi:hemerythrin-like domain-containing protein